MPEPAGPSATARRVAAYRLGFERVDSPGDSGSPAGDDLLASDVAGELKVDRASPMARYLQARTRFFDRVVVNALGREVTQIVIVGAGYDARALRYRMPGVRWWEVDRPATQVDKRSRLTRLGLAVDGVTFVGLDLSEGGLATALLESGFEPDATALFLLEGLVAYLDQTTIDAVLCQLRSVATPGTRLAISVARSEVLPAARARFESGVAALGEPAAGTMDTVNAHETLGRCRWRTVDLNDRAQTTGCVMAAPSFTPALLGEHETVGRIGTFVEQVLSRSGADTLGRHLEETYGVEVVGTKELDLGIFRIARADGSTWIARVFPATRAIADVRGDADLLEWLGAAGIPAEQTANADPVSMHKGQGVLVTHFVNGRHPPGKPALFERLGELLARIHSINSGGAVTNRPGGAWHHVVPDGTTVEELVATTDLLHAARHRVPIGHAAEYADLVLALERATMPSDLPVVLVHPDLVPRNVIEAKDGRLTVVDWSGAGIGPRVLSLGCLLWSAAAHGPSVEAAARGYRSAITLDPSELSMLESAMTRRPLVLACWSFATGRSPLLEATEAWTDQRVRVSKVVERARRHLS